MLSYTLTPCLLLFVPLAACVLSRLAMFDMLARRRPERTEFLALVLPGVCLDMLFVLPPLACFYAALLFFPNLPALGVLCLAITLVCALAVNWLNIIDSQVYFNTRQRFFPLIFAELRLTNIMTAASARQKALLGGLLLFSCAYPAALLFLFQGSAGQAAYWASGMLFALLALIFLCGTGIFAFGRRAVDPGLFIDSHGIGRHEKIRAETAMRAEVLRASALGNFLLCLRARLTVPPERPLVREYTEPEAAFLQGLELIRHAQFASEAEDSDSGGRDCPFRRIILICVESLSHKMLPFYNRKLSPEIMPFLGSLLESYPRLDRMQTSNSPTEHGLYALQGSRLGYEFDLARGLGRMDTLASLLAEQGFASQALSGVTRHYGDKDVMFRRLLRYDEFLGEEELKTQFPDAPPCGWGLADSAVYSAAVAILEKRREEKILINITTADTHPGYYHTLREDIFPECVRAGSLRLLRSLFEVDLNLMFFFRALAKARLYDARTLVIITADHSPNHGNEYMRMNNLENFFPDLIPLVFVTPARTENPFTALRPDIACSQLDILPTLVDGLRLRHPQHLLGRSLFFGQDNTAVSKYGAEMRFLAGERDYFIRLDTPMERQLEKRADADAVIVDSALGKWYANTLFAPYV